MMYLKMNCKNVVVYGVTLLICNNYLSNQLNSANAIEKPGVGLLGVFFIVCKLGCSFNVCMFVRVQRAAGKERKPQHWSCSQCSSSSPNQAKANHVSTVCFVFH